MFKKKKTSTGSAIYSMGIYSIFLRNVDNLGISPKKKWK